ncbi:MAG: thioredoxin domain-containing protein [Flavobacteriaceae bacterium]
MGKSNGLARETSPYLQQHADNPVHWQTWEQTDFEALQKVNTLLIISIGYASCHWCHVMERECFESEDVAALMNQHYHAIKIDREERPDLDHIYMQALQLLSGQGGWPLNIVALPDGRPIWGATYLPKDQWMASLQKIVDLQQKTPNYLTNYADQFESGMLENQSLLIKKKEAVNRFSLTSVLDKMVVGIDTVWGGYQAPKFPMPVLLRCFLHAGIVEQHARAYEHVKRTLEKMALGGIYDPIDGGFCRYAVDSQWHIPHFEKMGYDNGQLLTVYSEAFRQSPLPIYKACMEGIFHFLQCELKNPDGGYYCALDADSKNQLGETKEGAYYTWKEKELQDLLGKEFFRFKEFYNINSTGHWENGNYILFATKTPESFACDQKLTLSAFNSLKKEWHKKLALERSKRNKPMVDTKIIASWNALIATGFCSAYRVTQDSKFGTAAKQQLELLLSDFLDLEGVLHRQKNKETVGFLEDYALVIQALIEGYQTFFKWDYLHQAYELFEQSMVRFASNENPFFGFKSRHQKDTFINPIEVEDNVIPSSNAVMTENQWLLGRYFDRIDWVHAAQSRFQQMQPHIERFPRSYGHWIYLGILMQHKGIELVITGPNAKKEAKQFWKDFPAHGIIAVGTNMKETATLPLFNNRFDPMATQFFVCQQASCQLPTRQMQRAKDLIRSLTIS